MGLFGKKKPDQLMGMPMIPDPLGYTPLSFSVRFDTEKKDDKPKTALPVRQSAQPVRAWREWLLIFRDGEPFIRSLVREDVWEGPILRANEKPKDHTKLGDKTDTGHGIYAWPVTHRITEEVGFTFSMMRSAFTRQMMGMAAEEEPQPPGKVEGEVELIGRVVRHEHGYRAEAARVVRLFVKQLRPVYDRDVVLAALGQRYQCDVAWIPTFTLPTPQAEQPKEKSIRKRMKRAGLVMPTVEEYKAIMRSKKNESR